MNTTRATVTVSALALAAGLVATTTAAASAATVDEQLDPVANPLVSQEASGYRGEWAVSGSSVQEAFEQDGVVSAAGVTTTADLADGVWGAVWVSGGHADEYGAATIEYDTSTGTRTVSTDAVDVIAADQRAAEQG